LVSRSSYLPRHHLVIPAKAGMTKKSVAAY